MNTTSQETTSSPGRKPSIGSSNLQSIKQAIRSKWRGIIIGMVLSAGLGLFLLMVPSRFADSLVNQSYDLPFLLRPFSYPTEVVVVYLDDASYQKLDQKYIEPWNYDFFTRFLDRMTSEQASAVVLEDILHHSFDTNAGQIASDQRFADAIRRNGHVILASKAADPAAGEESDANLPEDRLFNEAAAATASMAVFADKDLHVRKYYLLPPVVGLESPSLPGEAWAAAHLTRPASVTRNPGQQPPFWLNFYGPSLVLQTASFYQAIANDDPVAKPGFFSNKVVFVGSRLQTKLQSDAKDEYPSPFSNLSDYKFMPEVAVHATAYLNIVRGDYLKRLPPWAEVIVYALVGILSGGSLVLCRPVQATFIALATAFPVALLDFFLFFHHNAWFPWLIIIAAQITVAWAWAVGSNYFQAFVERQLVEQSLSKYLSPKLVKTVAHNPTMLLPGAKKQPLTIMFSHVEGFAALTEGLNPDDLAHLMNEYFQFAAGDCIQATDGTVVKYISDVIFSFWNAPEPQPDHALRACQAALLFRDKVRPSAIVAKTLVTRIGLHTGVANVGNFGSSSRVDYTAIGENINLSSRMGGLNKFIGTRILMTAQTQEGVSDNLVTRYVGLFRLKGFERAVPVFEVMDPPDKEPDTREFRRQFAAALDLFAAKNFDAAQTAFHHALELKPGDGPSQFYLKQIASLRADPPPPAWKGEITLKEK